MKRVLAFAMALAMVITLIPVTSVSAATKPTLSKTTATIAVGETTTLSVKNKPSGATVKWSTSAKKIATVTQKGKVTGVKTGKATITAKVKKGSKTYTLKCKVTVKGLAKTVSTIAQLKTALKDKKLTKLTFKTSKSGTYTIPKGTYSKVASICSILHIAIHISKMPNI
jgi:uncharacterized protein YjdB